MVIGCVVLRSIIHRNSSLETFNTRSARVALYDHPTQCPYEYINLYEDRQHNNKFVLESKLKDQPRELDNVFESAGDFRDSWAQLGHVFPNLDLCPDPYQQYLNHVRQYYQLQKYVPSTRDTTTPIYRRDIMIGGGDTNSSKSVRQISLPSTPVPPTVSPPMSSPVPSIYSTIDQVNVRQLTRTVNNPSQLNTDRYMLPNSPVLQSNTQIDTSVTPASDQVPIVYNEPNLQLLKNQLIDDNFERQRTYQKQLYQMKGEIDQLRREAEWLRQQLVYEKRHFEDIDQSMEDKHTQILQTNQINLQLGQKIEELEQKNKQIEDLYLQADSQRNSLEVRLKTLRTSVEEQVKNSGYTYIPPTHWTMNQWRPPNCLTEQKNTTCPMGSTNNYATVFGDTQVHQTLLPSHQTISLDPIDHPGWK